MHTFKLKWTHLDEIARKVAHQSKNRHHPWIFRVKGNQERHWITAEVLLVLDEALRDKGHVALGEVVHDGTIATELLDEPHPEIIAFDHVQHLQRRDGDKYVTQGSKLFIGGTSIERSVTEDALRYTKPQTTV